jgi:hypothetical protein
MKKQYDTPIHYDVTETKPAWCFAKVNPFTLWARPVRAKLYRGLPPDDSDVCRLIYHDYPLPPVYVGWQLAAPSISPNVSVQWETYCPTYYQLNQPCHEEDTANA